ncbi:MAG: hypothetical protein WAM14_08590 [Candidatus Nitrosopolaris sp.]
MLRNDNMSINEGYTIIKKMDSCKMSVEEAYRIIKRYEPEE